jgi:PAS domain S-box-containing protein
MKFELMRDLTARLWPAIERTRAEEALRKSEDRFQLASQAVQSVIYDWDMANDHVSRSQELVNLLGFSNDEAGVATNEWYRSRVHPDDLERSITLLTAALDAGAERFEDEMRLQHRDGHYLWVRDCGLFLRDESGNVTRCVGSITDITARPQAEMALRESEARLSLALESGRMGAWDWDLTTDIQFWSPEQEKLFGWPPGKGIHETQEFFSQVHPDDRGRPSEADRARVSDEDYIEDEFRIIRPDGNVVWIASRSQLHRDEQGVAVRMSGVNMDVTERKKAEAALRESELHLSRLSEANIVGIVTASVDAVLSSNDEFLRMIGYSQEDAAAKRIDWQVMTPAEFITLDQRGLAQLIDQGWSEPYEKDFIRKDGTRVSVLVGGALLTREPLTWICFVVDLSERKRIEAALQTANYRFRIAEEAANSFSYDWNLETGVIERSAGL